METQKATTIASLPVEVLTECILARLPLLDLTFNARMVCKQWRDATKNISVDLYMEDIPFTTATSIMTHCYPLAHSLAYVSKEPGSIFAKRGGSEPPPSKHQLTDLIKAAKGLQSLTLCCEKKEVTKNHIIASILSASRTLTSLDLRIPSPDRLDSPISVVTQLPHLLHLTLKGIDLRPSEFEKLGTVLGRQLRSLNLALGDPQEYSSRKVTTTTATLPMAAFPSLETLKVKANTKEYILTLSFHSTTTTTTTTIFEGLTSLCLTEVALQLPQQQQQRIFPRLTHVRLSVQQHSQTLLPLGLLAYHAPATTTLTAHGYASMEDTQALSTLSSLTEAHLWIRHSEADNKQQQKKENEEGILHPFSLLTQVRFLSLSPSKQLQPKHRSTSSSPSSFLSSEDLVNIPSRLKAVAVLPQLEGLYLYDYNNIDVALLEKMLPSFECRDILRSFSLSHCRDFTHNTFNTLVTTFPNLTTLKLHGFLDCYNPSRASLFLEFLKKLPHLRRVSVSGILFTSLAPFAELPSLEELEVNSGVVGADVSALKPLSSLSQLKKLTLEYADIDDEMLANLPVCPSLEELNLHGCNLLTKDALQHISRCCSSSLQKLKIPETINLPPGAVGGLRMRMLLTSSGRSAFLSVSYSGLRLKNLLRKHAKPIPEKGNDKEQEKEKEEKPVNHDPTSVDTFLLTCETGFSNGSNRKWNYTEQRWRVWVSLSDSVETLRTKIRNSANNQVLEIYEMYHAPSALVQLQKKMPFLEEDKTLGENGVTPNSIIRWENGMID